VMSFSHHADSLVAVSRVAMETIPADQRHKAITISTGVDLRRTVAKYPAQTIRDEWYLRQGQKALVYLGRVALEKNPLAVARTIGALHRMGHTEWRGIVVGPSSLPKYNAMAFMPDFSGLSEEIAPGLVKFVGPCEDVGSVYAASDHMILPSFIEGNSLGLLEIWACGKPVLATPVGLVAHEHPDFVRQIAPNAMGWEMAQALIADIEDNCGTHERVERAKKTTIENYSCEVMGRKWTDHIVALSEGG
jgi:glycosyltransferase involved in cell wall biosynthesis